ncbi:hypothetical protein AB9K34_00345 [Sedimentitalea sp. XS_ASV28]|uniref:hypothetical protein n=1 Tax=Sedimentitalea sp. XS_ASV28 TaxID=3241296 RepID=UPI003514143E
MELSSFRNLNRNERVSSDDRSVLITLDEWMSCEVAPDDMPDRDGPCILGVDLGGSRSMSAAALFWPDTGRLECFGTFSLSNLHLPTVGRLTACQGAILRCRGGVNCRLWGKTLFRLGLGLPRSCATWTASPRRQSWATGSDMLSSPKSCWRQTWTGFRSSGAAFGWKDGAEDIERFRRALFDGEVKTIPSLLLRSAFSDAITLVDPSGNHKLAKARSLGRIDAAAAAILAIAEGMRRKATPSRRARLEWA